MKKCESCIYIGKTLSLEKEVKQLQDNFNELTIKYYNKLIMNLFLHDKVKALEEELKTK